MKVKQKTKDLAYVRRMIRNAISWYEVDDGFPEFWSSKNYKGAKKTSSGLYYTKSDKAIEEIAEKIYKKLRRENGR